MPETVFKGEWKVDIDREGGALEAYVWSLRPSIFRWPFLLALAVLGLLVALVILGDGGLLGWILAGAVSALLLCVLALRVSVRRTLRRAVQSGKTGRGSVCEVVLDHGGWHSDASGIPRSEEWNAYDRWAIWGDDLIVSQRQKGSWMPQRILLAPLSAFGSDRELVPKYVEGWLKR